MRLISSVFDDGEEIPRHYAAPGSNEMPPLEIDGVPAQARSLAIMLEDIDSPLGPVTHWLAWNIPPQTRHLTAGRLPEGVRVGLDTFGTVGYLGPSPPAGRHHYRFRLLALDRELDLPESSTRPDLERAMRDHILARAELTGVVEREDAGDE